MGSEYDILVVGGGIVGAGVARDAAMRGLRTLLIEQADFASGTSSRSSRLLHGGLRYLSQGRIGLVREASQEKMILSRIAPHLAHPLPFIFPTEPGTEWAKWKLSLGVRVYDWLCGPKNLGRSSTLSRAELMALVPGFRPEVNGGVRYFDAFTNDARLVIDTLFSAVRHSGEVRNYTRLQTAAEDGGLWQCGLSNGDQVRARSVVYAGGPWAQGLRLTKGIHIVIRRDRLPVTEAVVRARGSRIVFVIPWGERVIIGTTDTDYTGDPATVRAEPADIDYLLDATNDSFPSLRLGLGDVISTWAGIRPLLGGQSGQPSDISRAHVISMPKPGWFDVRGGKLTTYRRMAEQTVDRIGARWGTKLPPSRTGEETLLGPAPPWSSVLPPPFERAVAERIGTEEWTRHLDDLMVRRTSWHYYYGFDRQMAETAAEWMGFRGDEAAAEIERYRVSS